MNIDENIPDAMRKLNFLLHNSLFPSESFQNLLTPTEANKTRFTHSAGLKQSKIGLTNAEAVCLIGEYVFTAPLSEGCLLGGDLGWIVQAF